MITRIYYNQLQYLHVSWLCCGKFSVLTDDSGFVLQQLTLEGSLELIIQNDLWAAWAPCVYTLYTDNILYL